ncbi:F0F1 ATP synthase subunit B [Candidatus Gottesmanbacteria bacterium]|nr:F0F1 ATP synthase subunit B [Candidatus Gottesmanbacteria bacterium]
MEQLGIEPKLLLAQIINFTIIMVVLTKLLYKPILSMLEKRKKEIEAALALTEKMRLEEEKMKERKERLLSDARKEGHVVLDEMRKVAKEEEKEIIARARKEAEAIIEKGKQDVARLKEELMIDVRREAVGLAGAMVQKLLSRSLTNTDKHAIIAKNLKDLESVKG